MSESHQITIVDDDRSMSQAIERLLMTAGWTSRSFGSAEEFLDDDDQHPANFLILDIQLPGISGLELHRQIMASGKSVTVIFITGHDLPFLRASAERAGAAAYLTKPFPGGELLETVRSHLHTA